MREAPASKRVSFIAMMGALGNALAIITMPIFPLAPHVYLDFSSLPVLIAAVFGGAWVGAVTGFIAGLAPSVYFGFIGGSLGMLGFSASIGKALHGLVVGLLVSWLKPLGRRYGTAALIPIVVAGFIPEALWIYVVFKALVWFFVAEPVAHILSEVVVWQILSKASFEVVVMAFFVSALAGHEGFKSVVAEYLAPLPSIAASKAGKG
ncbi:MAG: hypothetical protein DRJ97_00575 [Thermoprotei archaeon]|nr:MAG: hypothetical protein DRJ97_00575 [Thermoprotei archaeon]